MKLKTYLDSLTMEGRVDFSERCETTYGHMRNVSYGYKIPRESLCINIERESGGLVTCEELREDVDWAYLRNSSKLISA